MARPWDGDAELRALRGPATLGDHLWTPSAWDTVKYPEEDARELPPTTTVGPVRVVAKAGSRKEAS